MRSQQGQENWFEIESDVELGDIVSPLLFVLYVDRCTRRIKIREEVIITFTSADDIVLVTRLE